MTLQLYYIIAGAAGIAGAAFCIYALVECGKVVFSALQELAGIEDYETP